MKRKLILSLLAMLLPISAWCADGDTFEYTPDGSNAKFYFRVLSEDSKTVELYRGSYSAAVVSATSGTLSGTVTVPTIAINSSTNYNVTRIGEYAFNATNLNEVILPTGVTEIGDYAFYWSFNLNSVTIPSTVTSIGANAFYSCALTTVTLPEGLVSIGDGAFRSCPLTSIAIPASVTSIGSNVCGNNDKLTSISVASGNSTYNSTGDCNAIIITATNELILGCKTTIIPNTVVSIGDFAFFEAGISGSFSIPEGVTSIGIGAFQSNSISSLEIPASIVSIGERAFANSYTSVSVASANAKYKSDGNCIIELASNELISAGKEVTNIPTGVQRIGVYAFYKNTSTSIEIPSTVLSIGNYAFANCSNLHTLTVPTTVNNVGDYAFQETGYVNYSEKSFSLYTPHTLVWIIKVHSCVSDYATVIPYVKPAKTYTSFACAQDVDFSSATGLKAYVASGFDASAKKVSLKEVTSAKAGEGIIIKATAGTKYDLALATASDNGTNLLKGVRVDTAIEPTDGSNTNFLLSDGQFKKAQAGTLANGKAYLQLPTSAAARAKSLGITTEGDVTGIINIDLDEEGDGMIYDLNGHRISETATKGIYVKNGKKVIIK